MPIPGILHPLKSREAGWDLHVIELTVGATGAVTSVDGKGMATTGTASGELGGIVRNGVGDYTVTLPGYGGVQKIVPLECSVIDGAVGDSKSFAFVRTASARTLQILCVDNATDAAEELSSGTVLVIPILVKNGSAE